MKLLQYSVWKKETNTAGGKAKNDAFDIALEMGFKPSYKPSDVRLIRVLQQIVSMGKIKKADILFVQYPAIENRMQEILFKNLKRDAITVALIHDLPSIQGMRDGDKDKEIQQLSHFTHLIVHNRSMEQYLREMGYQGRTICLELFDYLHDESKTLNTHEFRNSAFVAGNLEKGQYILELGKVGGCNFDLFGLKGDMDFSKIPNAEYKGMLPSDEIVYKVTGDYALIWDGDSINGCTGVYGKYLKYNNPHKLSLCMAAGRPAIVWKKSAVAEFVEKERVGICIDSLEELNQIDLKKDYAEFKNNAMRIKRLVANGEYLKKALQTILNEVQERL